MVTYWFPIGSRTIPKNSLVLFHGGSTFSFWSNFTRHIKLWVIAVLLSCPWQMVLLQLPTILFIRQQQQIMGITLLDSWRVSSTAFCRRSRKVLRCHLWSSARSTCFQIFPDFLQIKRGTFVPGTRVMTALNKVENQYLRTERRRDACRFLEELVNCLLSTAASKSPIVQGKSSFNPAIVIGGDDVAQFQFFNKLMDRL